MLGYRVVYVGGGRVCVYVRMCVGVGLRYLGWAGRCIYVICLTAGLLAGRDNFCRCGSSLGCLRICVSKCILRGA